MRVYVMYGKHSVSSRAKPPCQTADDDDDDGDNASRVWGGGVIVIAKGCPHVFVYIVCV